MGSSFPACLGSETGSLPQTISIRNKKFIFTESLLCFPGQFRDDFELAYHVQEQVDRFSIFDIYSFQVLSKLKQSGGGQL